jgi:hypothetical protein
LGGNHYFIDLKNKQLLGALTFDVFLVGKKHFKRVIIKITIIITDINASLGNKEAIYTNIILFTKVIIDIL